MAPRRRSAAGGGRDPGEPPRRDRDRPLGARGGLPRRAAGHRSQRTRARRSRRHGAPEDATHARRRHRPRVAHRARRGRRDLDRRGEGGGRARPGGARRLLAGRRRRRLHARRRALVARAQARDRREPGDCDRARDRRRRVPPCRPRERAGPVLGPPRGRRRVRRRDRDRVQPLPDHRGLRGPSLLPGRARRRSAARMARLDGDRPGRDHERRAHPAAAADRGDPRAVAR